MFTAILKLTLLYFVSYFMNITFQLHIIIFAAFDFRCCRFCVSIRHLSLIIEILNSVLLVTL